MPALTSVHHSLFYIFGIGDHYPYNQSSEELTHHCDAHLHQQNQLNYALLVHLHQEFQNHRSIIASKQVLQRGLRKRIGNGYDTKVWEEPWLQLNPARPPSHAGHSRDEDLRVHHLIDFERKTWNLDWLHEMITPADIDHITSIKISRTGRHDCYSWDFSKSGLYTVKSGHSVAYDIRTSPKRLLLLEPSTKGLKTEVWKLKAPRKLKHFLWQAISGYLATAQQLRDRHCAQDSSSMRCGAENESINHTLFECPPALQVWAHSLIPSSPGRFPCSSLFGNFDYLLLCAKKQGLNGAVMTPIPWILWYIWKARKEKVFNNKDIFPLETLQLAVKEAESWNLAQRVEAIEDPSQKDPPTSGRTMQTTETTPFQWRCQSDASWTSNKD